MSVDEILIKLEEKITYLLENGDKEKVKDLFQKITCNLYSIESVVLISDGELDKAEDILLSGLQKYGNDFDLCYNLAYLYQLTGRYDEAVEAYEKAKALTNKKEIVWEIDKLIEEIEREHKNEPLVSVCMPVYNDENYIIKGIESVLNQTYQNFEIIICDNNSEDLTYEKIRSIRDSRIKLFRNDENIGFLLNSNKVWKKAKGKYIVTLHGDDAYNETYIENVVKIFNNNSKVGIIHFVHEEVKQNYFDGMVYFKSKKYYSKIYGALVVPAPTETAFCKNALINTNYYEEDYWTAEKRLMMNIAKQGYDAYIEGQYLFDRYNGPEKDSSQIDKFVLRFEHLYQFYREFKDDKKIKYSDHESLKKSLFESFVLMFQNKDKSIEIDKVFKHNKELIKNDPELSNIFIDYVFV